MPTNIKCKHCDKLKKHWCEAVLDSPDEDMERDCRFFRHKTNADRIRAMSDEELADFITNCGCYDHARDCRASCKDCTMDWLKQPVED